jgi:hypothetical protein
VVLYLASDLLWATRIKSCADDLTPPVPARPVRNMEMLEARLGDCAVTGVLLDLAAGEEGREGETAFLMLGRLKRGIEVPSAEGRGASGGVGKVKVVVFGPHVQAEQLAAAKKAGADVVMARGALAANLPRVLRELEGGGPTGLKDQLID